MKNVLNNTFEIETKEEKFDLSKKENYRFDELKERFPFLSNVKKENSSYVTFSKIINEFEEIEISDKLAKEKKYSLMFKAVQLGELIESMIDEKDRVNSAMNALKAYDFYSVLIKSSQKYDLRLISDSEFGGDKEGYIYKKKGKELYLNGMPISLTLKDKLHEFVTKNSKEWTKTITLTFEQFAENIILNGGHTKEDIIEKKYKKSLPLLLITSSEPHKLYFYSSNSSGKTKITELNPKLINSEYKVRLQGQYVENQIKLQDDPTLCVSSEIYADIYDDVKNNEHFIPETKEEEIKQMTKEKQISLFKIGRNISGDYFHVIYENGIKKYLEMMKKLCLGKVNPYDFVSFMAVCNSVKPEKFLFEFFTDQKEGAERKEKNAKQAIYFLTKFDGFMKQKKYDDASMALIGAGLCGKTYHGSNISKKGIRVNGGIDGGGYDLFYILCDKLPDIQPKGTKTPLLIKSKDGKVAIFGEKGLSIIRKELDYGKIKNELNDIDFQTSQQELKFKKVSIEIFREIQLKEGHFPVSIFKVLSQIKIGAAHEYYSNEFETNLLKTHQSLTDYIEKIGKEMNIGINNDKYIEECKQGNESPRTFKQNLFK